MRKYLRAANVGWSGLLLDDVKSMNFSDSEMDTFRLKPGDILLNEASGSAAEVGKPAIWNGEIEDCAFQNTLLRVRCAPDADPRYLLHYFRWQAATAAFARGSRGVGINHLGREALAKWPVPLPLVGEQRRIAVILDRVDSLRQRRREVIGLVELLERTAFVDLFGNSEDGFRGFDRDRLGAYIADGPQNGVYKPSSAYGQGTPIVRIDSFKDGGMIKEAALKRVTLSEGEVSRYALQHGDLVINRVNAPIHLGKATRIVRLKERTVYESNMMRLRLDTARLRPEYVLAFLQTPYAKRQIKRVAKAAVNQSSINQADVQGLQLPIPPVTLQVAFAEQLKAIHKFRLTAECQKTQFDRLCASLQQRAFSGQL